MHVHTSISSPCSFIDPERAIKRAKEIGLDGICVTDHDGTEGAEIAFELGKKLGFPVFRGLEVYTEFGDVIIFGVYDNDFTWKVSFDEVIEICRNKEGIAIVAHISKTSTSFSNEEREVFFGRMLRRVNAIETHNGGSTPDENERALKIAQRYSLTGVGGSDAHHEFQIGRCVTVFEKPVVTERELVKAVREGICRGKYGFS